ncbi:MAG: hypothetical protein DRP11_00250 [Candidatus Aenigmatarchaeota archaeon]|nr:MAG: hypothetical protein DRP11_00250 [Candidatus Aenigmarchaeota archaeon]
MNPVLVVFFLSLFFFSIEVIFPGTAEVLALSREPFMPYTLFTYIFVHADIQHLVSNMFALLIFGLILERLIGEREFLKVFFISGFASAGGLFFYDSIVGASGAIFGLIGALAVIRPKMMVYVGVPLPMIGIAFVWGLLDLVGVLGTSGNVASASHLLGLLFGALLGLRYREESIEEKEEILTDEEIDEWERRYMLNE